MTVVQFTTIYEGMVLAGTGVTRAAFNRMKKRAYRDIGIYWHRVYLPRHFTVAGGRKYGYVPRKGEKLAKRTARFRGSYTGRKWRKERHTKPLVLSGDSEQASRIRDVRATATGVKVVLHTPKLAWPTKGNRMRMAEEVTRLAPDEHTQLVKLFDKTIERKMRRYRRQIRRRARA